MAGKNDWSSMDVFREWDHIIPYCFLGLAFPMLITHGKELRRCVFFPAFVAGVISSLNLLHMVRLPCVKMLEADSMLQRIFTPQGTYITSIVIGVVMSVIGSLAPRASSFLYGLLFNLLVLLLGLSLISMHAMHPDFYFRYIILGGSWGAAVIFAFWPVVLVGNLAFALGAPVMLISSIDMLEIPGADAILKTGFGKQIISMSTGLLSRPPSEIKTWTYAMEGFCGALAIILFLAKFFLSQNTKAKDKPKRKPVQKGVPKQRRRAAPRNTAKLEV